MFTGTIAGKVKNLATIEGMHIGTIIGDDSELQFATRQPIKNGKTGIFTGSMEPVDGSLIFRINSIK